MTEEFEMLKDIASRLDSAGIEYMMTGSMAMALYASPRMTRDVDIIIRVSPDDSGRIVELFRDEYYIEETAVRDAIQNRGMFNAIHNKSVIKVDFIIRKDDEYRREEFSRRKRTAVQGMSISVVSPEDLILSKLVWSKMSDSELQFRDARQIVSSLKDLDRAYMDTWAEKLHVGALLNKARGHE